MNNKWFRLSLVSFVGIIVSIIGLYVIQLISVQQSQIGTNHQVGALQSSDTHGNSHNATNNAGTFQHQYAGQGYVQPQYPYHGFRFGFGNLVNQNYNNGYVWGPMNAMRSPMNQVRYRMNMNNFNNINNMNSMPIM